MAGGYKSEYVVDPRVAESYVTTAALYGQEMKLEGRRSDVTVRAHDIGRAKFGRMVGCPETTV